MLPEDLPHCLCKEANWQGHGGSFGGLQQSNFKCGACGRFSSFIAAKGGNMLLMCRKPGEGMSDRVMDWINGSILAVWRDNYDKHDVKVKEHVKNLDPFYALTVHQIAATALADLGAGGPLAAKVFPLLNKPGANVGDRAVLLRALFKTLGQWEPDFVMRIRDPEGAGLIDDPEAPRRMALLNFFAQNGQHEESAQALEILRGLELRKKSGKNNWYQKGFPEIPVPPQVPGDEIACWIQTKVSSGWGWEYIDPDKTQDLPIPPDPIRVRHDAFYKEVFEKTGLETSPRAEIPNGYYGDKFNKEPWYEFKVNGYTLTFGPRKRVVSIKIEHDDEFDCTSLRALYERDQVTYEADGGWHSDKSKAKKVLIHAWGKEKTIEYVQAMLEVATA